MDPLAPQAGRGATQSSSGSVRPEFPSSPAPAQPAPPGEREAPLQPKQDAVAISPQALARARVDAEGRTAHTSPTSKTTTKTPSDAPGSKQTKEKAADSIELSGEERDQVRKLRARDTEVRTHEQAHMSAGGSLTGGASYEYEQGPDGNQYAVGGEVGISMPSGGSPEELISNARQVRRAALAPSQPSSQDQSVAAQASQMEAQAQAELAKESRGEDNGEPGKAPQDPAAARAAQAYGEVANATQEEADHTPFARTA